MRVERAGDLMFVTYFMIDWKSEKQAPSGEKCAQCGGEMRSLQAKVGVEGLSYEGLACHSCKRVLWLRSG